MLRHLSAKTAVPVALVFAALLACKGSDNSAAPSAAPSAGAAPAAAAPSEVTAETMGTFVCKEIQEDACVGITDRFPVDAPVVHVSYKTKSIPKSGEEFSMQWIAEDVGAAAKPNTVVATVKKKVEELPDFGVTSYSLHTQLTKPDAGWPVGKYRVEIKLGDALVTTARFQVAKD